MKKYKDSPFAPSNYMREMNWLTEDIKKYNRLRGRPVTNRLPPWHLLDRVAKNPQDKTLHPNKWKEKGTNMRSAPRGPVTHNSSYSYRSEGPARDARGKPAVGNKYPLKHEQRHRQKPSRGPNFTKTQYKWPHARDRNVN